VSKARAHAAGGKQWTAAGAARFAREARAQTVLHLAKARTPVRWQVYGLSAGFDLWRRMCGSRRLAAEVLLGPIGYPPPYAGSIDDYAQQITRDCATATAAASLFVVSPTMHDVVAAASVAAVNHHGGGRPRSGDLAAHGRPVKGSRVKVPALFRQPEVRLTPLPDTRPRPAAGP
jgi:hypothetical protein